MTSRSLPGSDNCSSWALGSSLKGLWPRKCLGSDLVLNPKEGSVCKGPVQSPPRTAFGVLLSEMALHLYLVALSYRQLSSDYIHHHHPHSLKEIGSCPLLAPGSRVARSFLTSGSAPLCPRVGRHQDKLPTFSTGASDLLSLPPLPVQGCGYHSPMPCLLSDPLPSPGFLFSGLPWEALVSSGKGPMCAY